METVGKWSTDYTIGLRKFANRPSILLKLWTESFIWAKRNIPTKIIEQNSLFVIVEIEAEIEKAKIREGGVLVSECSSIQISNFTSSLGSSIHQSMLQISNSDATATASSQPVSAEIDSVPPISNFSTKDYKNFELYRRSFLKWTVTIAKNENSLYESRCNCPAFAKEYICKHVIGLTIRLKLVSHL